MKAKHAVFCLLYEALAIAKHAVFCLLYEAQSWIRQWRACSSTAGGSTVNDVGTIEDELLCVCQ